MSSLVPLKIYARARYKLLVSGLILFICSGLGVMGFLDYQSGIITGIIRIAGVLGLVFFGFGTIVIIRRLFGPVLVVDKEGIIDNASGTAVGRIPWTNIAEIRIVQFLGQSDVGIVPIDLKRVFDSCGFLARMAIRMRERQGVPPIIIPTSSLGIDSAQLISDMKSYQPYSQ